MACVFIFYVKIFVQSIFIYTIHLLKPNLFQSSIDTGCSVGLKHPMKSIFEHEEELNYSDKFMPLLAQGLLRLLPCHKYLIVLCEQLRWTSKHRPIKFNTFLGYTHMDHYTHTCAFTVAYIILWLEVLLHYSTVKVFHIRCATRGGGSPTLFWKSKKCRNFGKKLLILSILKLNLPLKI